MPATVRKAAVAGSWYPAEPARLAEAVEAHLAAARPAALSGRLVALISPHAGLVYSGPVAAYGYALLRGRRELTAVLVGPSHREWFEGAAVWARGAFETPLGPLPVDEDLAGRLLAAGPGMSDDPGPHRAEHSLEMQLPFLKHVAPAARIVPVLMGSQSRAEVERLAAALARALPGREALLVASSDLSHYLPADRANATDALVIGDVERFDPEALLDRLERSRGHACGGGPMTAVLMAARALGADRTAVLRYGDSGDVAEGDKTRVVGYVSAAVTAPERT